MKTKEELNTLKKEVETLSRKLHELTEEELSQVTGGDDLWTYQQFCNRCGYVIFERKCQGPAMGPEYRKIYCPQCDEEVYVGYRYIH